MAQVAFVTGGTRGIGQAIAQALLARGARVAITGTSDDGVRHAAQALAETGGDEARVMGVCCDVRDPDEVERALAATVARFGGLDVLVNNAGVGVGAAVADLSIAEWRRLLDVNLSGAFHCCRAAIPHLRRRGGGWIFNISSLAGSNPFAGGAAYAATKAGLDALSEGLMQELRGDDIRVSCICPGSVSTGFNGRQPGNGADWKLHPEDVALVLTQLLEHPARSLPSRVEIRPARPATR